MSILRIKREEKGLTQSQMAEKLDVSESAISHYENGRRTPNITVLQKYSDCFGCTIDELVKAQ